VSVPTQVSIRTDDSIRARIEELTAGSSSAELALIGRIVQRFLDALPERLDAIETAIAAHDDQAIAFTAHALRGSSGNLGAEELASACAELEEQALAGTAAPATTHLAQIRAASDLAAASLRTCQGQFL
jgi:HPt (histidine-containing phosphotransfer) domain-containing protein